MHPATRARRFLTTEEGHLDLVPLIDCMFLILIFFVLAGRLTADIVCEQITVPPAKSGSRTLPPGAWTREVVQIGAAVRLGPHLFTNDPRTWAPLRAILDRTYDLAAKDVDPLNGTRRARVIVELRADGDAETRTVQELERLLTDTIDPVSQQPKAATRPFTMLAYSVRKPG
jgi:biopolymer transport protein ExbD